MRRFPNHLTVLFLSLSILMSIIYYYRLLFTFPVKFHYEKLVTVVKTPFLDVYTDDLYSLRTAGCSIRRLDPSEPSLAEFFERLDPFICSDSGKERLVLQKPNGILKVNQTAKKILMKNSNHNTTFRCEKREVYRNRTQETDYTQCYRISKNMTEFSLWVDMPEEYVQVLCFEGDNEIYHNYFFRIVRHADIEEESRKNSDHFEKEVPACSVSGDRLSVLVIGVDSMSKVNFFRQMPQTAEYVSSEFRAVDMLGYNKVGLNTFPCLMPYLTGQSVDEMAEGCWGGKDSDTFDDCVFLWDRFAKAGYRTAFVENMDNFGTLHQSKAGIERQLAHYYGHTLYQPVLQYSMDNYCWRGEPDDYQVTKWAFDFQRQFRKDLHFGHFWLSSFSHDDVNMAQHLDPIMLELFQKIHKHLNRTLLIFMSDHGIRFGKFRNTEKGRLEENLPFMYLKFPSWFERKFKPAFDILTRNRYRLITNFDLHETLIDVLNCRYTGINQSSSESKSKGGISLFEPISDNRTCEDAKIPEAYCACKEEVVEMSTNSSRAKKLAKLIVAKINNLTTEHRDVCVFYKLQRVLGHRKFVQRLVDPEFYPKQSYVSDIVTILVMPGGASFEASIIFHTEPSVTSVDPNVRRINRYGDTSECVGDNSFMKSLCFCKNQKKS